MLRRLGLQDSPINLAVARIIIFAALLYSIERWAPSVVSLAALPSDLLHPPRVMNSLVRWFPPSQGFADCVCWALRAIAVCGLLGAWSRTMCLTACLLSTYFFGLMWCFGAVSHKLHHFPMLLAILAASRCGDALSIDAWRRQDYSSGLASRFSPLYGVPVRALGVCIGLIYFFPGVWKLNADAAGWFSGEALRLAFWRDWSIQEPPPFRPDEWPGALAAMGTATICYEVLFLPLVFWKRARPVLVAAGVFFHTGVLVLMGIDFIAFSICLLILVDWDSLFVRWRQLTPPVAATDRRIAPRHCWSIASVLCVSSIIWFYQVSLGSRDIENRWPIAAYPSFRHLHPTHRTTTIAVEVEADGSERRLPDEPMRRLFAGNWHKIRQELRYGTDWEPGKKRFQRALLRFWALQTGVDPDATTLRLYAARISILPPDWNQPPVIANMLIELRPGQP